MRRGTQDPSPAEKKIFLLGQRVDLRNEVTVLGVCIIDGLDHGAQLGLIKVKGLLYQLVDDLLAAALVHITELAVRGGCHGRGCIGEHLLIRLGHTVPHLCGQQQRAAG